MNKIIIILIVAVVIFVLLKLALDKMNINALHERKIMLDTLRQAQGAQGVFPYIPQIATPPPQKKRLIIIPYY